MACLSLKEIKVDEYNINYRSVNGNLYSKDGKVLVAYAAGKEVECFIIPHGVTRIGAYAFNYCSRLASITIPNSVTNIWSGAFMGCDELIIIAIPDSVTIIADVAFSGCRSLTSVIYKGSKLQWANVIKGKDLFVYTQVEYIEFTKGLFKKQKV